jgi:hypothetical protein
MIAVMASPLSSFLAEKFLAEKIFVSGKSLIFRGCGAGLVCISDRSERVFDSFPEQVFVVKPFPEHLFHEQMFAFSHERMYDLPHV